MQASDMATVAMADKAAQFTSAQTNEQKADRCMLFELPVELRLHIYSYLWEPPPPTVFMIIKGSTIIRDTRPLTDAPALMATCRNLNTEVGHIVYHRRFAVCIQNHTATTMFGGPSGFKHLSKDFLRRCSMIGLQISYNGASCSQRATELLETFHQALVLLRGNSELEAFDIDVNLTDVDTFVRDEVMGELVSTKERHLEVTLRGEKELDKLAIGWRMLWKLTAVLEMYDMSGCQEHDDMMVGGPVVGYDGIHFEFF